VIRLALGVGGLATIAYGASLLLDSLDTHALIRLPFWLGGAVVADDLVLIPLTLAAGWLLTRWAAKGADGNELAIVRTALLYVGITTLIALPLMLRQGKGANPTSLSRDYRQDWLMLEAIIVTVAAAALMIRRYRRLRTRHGPTAAPIRVSRSRGRGRAPAIGRGPDAVPRPANPSSPPPPASPAPPS
jgi:hypothetical protein